MRTTVTLDPDLAARLKQLARERGTSFEEVLNTALRRGLADVATRAGPFREQTYPTLAIEHGAELCSADADFSRFPGLRWTNPLTSRAS